MLATAAAEPAGRGTELTLHPTILYGVIRVLEVPEDAEVRAETGASCSTIASPSPSNPADLRGAVDSYFLPKAAKSSRCEVIA